MENLKQDPNASSHAAPRAVEGLQANGLGAMIEQTLKLPTMPFIAGKVIAAIDKPETSIKELTALIEADQGIASKVLRIANSSFYGRPRKVSNVRQALMVLGFSELKNLVVAIAAKSIYKSQDQQEMRLWEHSVGCAIGTTLLARSAAPEVREVAFVAGQMHDVGRVVMRMHHPGAYREAERRSGVGGDVEYELKLFGFSHPDVGAVIMKRWNLPEALEEAAFHHHDLGLGSVLAANHARLIACVAISDHLCHRAGIGSAPIDLAISDDIEEALSILSLNPDQLIELEAALKDAYAKERSLLG